jgi:hypothetical protein
MDLEFITEDEISVLPDDPRRAFVEFTKIVESRLQEQLSISRNNDDNDLADEVRYSYQSIILAAARKFAIEPFAQTDLPRIDEFRYDRFKQFRADLQHYLMQIRLGLAEQDRGESIPLPEKSTESIRTRLHGLRDAIDRDLDLTEATKARLHRRLNEFEDELKRKRIRLWAVARIVFEILAVPGAINESRAALQDFASFVMREIGEARVADNENRQIPYQEPLALMPPRQGEATSQGSTRKDLEDEIPF